MRVLSGHDVDGLGDGITVTVQDEPGEGGANHAYTINYTDGIGSVGVLLNFQNRPVREVGFNGITNEALLVILIDRLQGFQSGPYRCRENAIALTDCEEALMWLQKRTRDRMARGVEGTSDV